MFPIVIPVTRASLEEFVESEWGSYEDAGHPEAGHVVNILQRFKRKIEVRSAEEANLVYEAVCSGTFQLFEKNFRRTALKIANALRPHALPETVKLWPGPSGY